MFQTAIQKLNFFQPAVIRNSPQNTSWVKFNDRIDTTAIRIRSVFAACLISNLIEGIIPYRPFFHRIIKASPYFDLALMATVLLVSGFVSSVIVSKIETSCARRTIANEICEQFKRGVNDQTMSDISCDPETVQALLERCPHELLSNRSPDGNQRTVLQWTFYEMIPFSEDGDGGSRPNRDMGASIAKSKVFDMIADYYAQQKIKISKSDLLQLTAKSSVDLLICRALRHGIKLGVFVTHDFNGQEMRSLEHNLTSDPNQVDPLKSIKQEILQALKQLRNSPTE